jgi:hypothetical protein
MRSAGTTSRRAFVAAVTAVAVLAAPSAASAPQVTDPAGDANAGAYWRGQDTATPVGSQAYADVVAVEFRTTRAIRVVRGRRAPVVTGFTVTMRLSAPPSPPRGVGVYRVLASGPGCLFGVDYYTRAVAGQQVAAIQEWCTGSSIRRVAIKPPSVKGAAITWTVPLSALPRNTRAGAGTTLTDLHFQVLVRTDDAVCAGAPGAPAEEREPCAVVLDDTLDRGGTYTIR